MKDFFFILIISLIKVIFSEKDFLEFKEYFLNSFKVNDSNIIYLHKDVNNTYKQYYPEHTNILNTEIDNSYFNLHVKQIDCVMIKKDILIKKYVFTNNNSIDLNINFVVHSKVISSFNNMAGGLLANDALVQYSHNFTCAILSKNPLLSHQLNDVERNYAVPSEIKDILIPTIKDILLNNNNYQTEQEW